MIRIQISSKQFSDLQLKSIEKIDQEKLCKWKNINKKSFFFQETITEEMQMKWFCQYKQQDDNIIFMIEEWKNQQKLGAIGCIGYRLVDNNTIDIYNVIRGSKSKSNATMREAMHMMLNYIRNKYPNSKIKCDVLKNNPAVLWYKKCGFVISQEKEYYIMSIDENMIKHMEICVEEETL